MAGEVTNAPPIVLLGPATGEVELHPTFAEACVRIPLVVHRPGEPGIALFSQPVHLRSVTPPDFVFLENKDARPSLLPISAGRGELGLTIRSPIERKGDRMSTTLPLPRDCVTQLKIRTPQAGLQMEGAALWERSGDAQKGFVHELSSAGAPSVTLSWSDAPGSPEATPGSPLHGMSMLSSRHLTVINTDGSCTHAADYVLAGAFGRPFVLALPPGAAVVSGSLDGVALDPATLRGSPLSIAVPESPQHRAEHQLSLSLSCAPVHLGFLGHLTLSLPDPSAITGNLSWNIAVPPGYRVQTLSGGLDMNREPVTLDVYGTFGEALRDHTLISLRRALVPAQPVAVRLRYRQALPGFNDEITEDRQGSRQGFSEE
jgi:hypothetical protein